MLTERTATRQARLRHTGRGDRAASGCGAAAKGGGLQALACTLQGRDAADSGPDRRLDPA